MKNFEQTHAKNVAGCEDLVTYCTAFGTRYNPSNESISLASLTNQYSRGAAAMEAVAAVLPAQTTAVAVKNKAYEPLDKLVTRVLNNFASSGALPAEIKKAMALAKKIRGESTPTDKAKKAKLEGKKPRSNSQQSMDMRMENFGLFIEVVAANSKYQPNEPELQVPALQNYLAQLKVVTQEVTVAGIPVTAAKSKRNAVLYTEETGLVPVCRAAKKYLRSILLPDSPEYKKIAAIKFFTFRKR